MKITYDPVKREKTITDRGVDFADAWKVFSGMEFTFPDDRKEYGEPRSITVGHLKGKMTVVVWTPREGGHRILSMRYANERENARYRGRLG
ncbi:MAG: BrnT family toxin [Magnetococcales bacterium]|nr:BrnT family toxin [Magnetococcales bacterium]